MKDDDGAHYIPSEETIAQMTAEFKRLHLAKLAASREPRPSEGVRVAGLKVMVRRKGSEFRA